MIIPLRRPRGLDRDAGIFDFVLAIIYLAAVVVMMGCVIWQLVDNNAKMKALDRYEECLNRKWNPDNCEEP
jgi:hypothetical protein